MYIIETGEMLPKINIYVAHSYEYRIKWQYFGLIVKLHFRIS
jgi:hypothetical protein